MEPLQRAGRTTRARSTRSRPSSTATTRCWSAPTPRFRFAVDQLRGRGLRRPADRRRRVPSRLGQPGQQARPAPCGQLIARDKVHVVAMTGSYFRGDAEAVLTPQDEAKFETVTYTYYEQLNGYEYLKRLDIGYFFYSGSYVDEILQGARPDREDDRPHPERQLAREHEGQDQGGRGHHRRARRLAGRRSRDRLPAGQDARRPSAADRRSGRRRPGKARACLGRAEGPERRRTTATMSTSSSRSAWRRRASTGSGASMR